MHDLSAARAHVRGTRDAAAAQGRPALAGGGDRGAGIGVHVPITQSGGSQVRAGDNRADHVCLRALRAPGARGFALLTTRGKARQHVTACPHKIGDIGKAALVLTHIEHKYIPC